jgi:hypothetical protein
MADTKLKDLTEDTSPASTDIIYKTDSGGTTQNKVQGANIHKAMTPASDTVASVVELATTAETNTGTDSTRAVTPAGLAGSTQLSKDGWVVVLNSWTYLSATTITVPSGAASIYSVGDKIKLTQTTVKYFYVTSVADTVLTVAGGSAYVVVNAAISAIGYSKLSSPVGFPKWHSLTFPSWAASGTGFTNDPTGTIEFRIDGAMLWVKADLQLGSPSDATGYFNATFTTGEMPSMATFSPGTTVNYSNVKAGVAQGSNNTIGIALYDGTTIGTSGNFIGFMLSSGF